MSIRMEAVIQNKKIQAKKKTLIGVFSKISEDKRELATTLIDRVAFMSITLDLLEEDIKENGPVTLFVQGKQEMMIENPAQKSYNTMINRYTAAVKQLLDLLPKNEEPIDDGFEDFIKRADEK